jgi:RNA polymerase sigma factor (sigma-70 family)
MNYAKYRASMLRHDNPVMTNSQQLERQRFIQIAYATRNVIAEHNLRLVVHLAKHVRLAGMDFGEIISNGNMSLLKSIDKFDVNRRNKMGSTNKFSTYATTGIKKNFWRDITETNKRLTMPLEDDFGEINVLDPTSLEEPTDDYRDEIEHMLRTMKNILDEREMIVLKARYQIDESWGRTLEAIGYRVGLTKERVRQIEAKAMKKLREAFRLPGAQPEENEQQTPVEAYSNPAPIKKRPSRATKRTRLARLSA